MTPVPEPPATTGARAAPGRVAWAFVAVGWVIMAVAVFGMLDDPRLGSSTSWATWVIGAAIVHDAVLLPVVVGVGWLLGRFLAPTWRTPWRVALVVGGVISLTVFPIARRYGARADNPSILPLDVARNLLELLAALAVAALAAGPAQAYRRRRRTRRGGTS